MGTANLGLGLTVAGVTANLGATASGEGETKQEVTLEKAYAGPISTDTDRVITTTVEDPDIEAADKVAIFWADGMARDTVQSVSGEHDQTIKLSSGGADHEGDTLPDDATACIIAVELDVTFAWAGNDTQAIAVDSGARASISFRKAADALCSTVEHTLNMPYYYMTGLEMANPVADDAVEVISIATADTAADRLLAIGFLIDTA